MIYFNVKDNFMETEIVKTNDLTQEQVELINSYILPEFDEYLIQPLRYPDTSRFIFIKDSNQVVSFARIIDTKIEFVGKELGILGLSMVYSIVKGKGLGKKLIEEIKHIAESEGKVLLGNCELKNKEFYIKCGLEVLENTIIRFVFINSHNIGEINKRSSIVLIFDSKKDFINQFLGSPSENVFIFEHWW